MKKIIEAIHRIADDYNLLLELESSSNKFILQGKMERLVNDTVRSMFPLRYNFIKLEDFKLNWRGEPDENGHNCLGIGSGMRAPYLKWERSYGSIITEYYDLIRKKGEVLIPFLRRPIRSDFRELVEKTKKLKDYESFSVERELLPTEIESLKIFSGGRSLTFRKRVVHRIGVKADDPSILKIRFKEGPSFEISRIYIKNEFSVIQLEPILDDVLKLYRELNHEIQKIERWNRPLLEEIDLIRKSYVLSNKLKK